MAGAVVTMRVGGLEDVNTCLEALTQIAERQLRARSFPTLYTSGVKYQREGVGKEQWLTPAQMMQLGAGDCEDLAAWRAAELRVQGIRARAVCRRVRPGLIHCVVRMPNGQYEDPSKKLGMRGAG